MSVFAGGLSLESADALGQAIDLDEVGSVEGITTLVESGLVVRSHSANGVPRFHLLETIREFGLEQLAEEGELERARRFHAEHFLALRQPRRATTGRADTRRMGRPARHGTCKSACGVRLSVRARNRGAKPAVCRGDGAVLAYARSVLRVAAAVEPRVRSCLTGTNDPARRMCSSG